MHARKIKKYNFSNDQIVQFHSPIPRRYDRSKPLSEFSQQLSSISNKYLLRNKLITQGEKRRNNDPKLRGFISSFFAVVKRGTNVCFDNMVFFFLFFLILALKELLVI